MTRKKMEKGKLVTFEDLKFKPHMIGMPGHTQAVINFPNGYGASVVCGTFFYSNGSSTYELAVMTSDGDGPIYNTPITKDVEGNLTRDQVTEMLQAISKLPKRKEEK